MKSIEESIKKGVQRRGKGAVVTPFDFLKSGSRDAVDQGLSRLTRKGVLQRVDRGLYNYPKQDPLLGQLSPSPEAVAKALARRDAAKLLPTGAMAANMLGLSEQVPMKVAYLTSGPKRQAKIKNLTVTLRPTVAKNLATADRVSGVVIQALRYLGKGAVGPEQVRQLCKRLNPKQRQQLVRDIPYAPAWMGPIFRQIAADGEGDER